MVIFYDYQNNYRDLFGDDAVICYVTISKQ